MWMNRWLSVAQRVPIVCRHFRISAALPAKTFVDHENQFAHGILANSIKPYQILRSSVSCTPTSAANATTLAPERVLQPAAVVTPDELNADFETLVQHCAVTQTPISDARFASFTQSYCDNLHRLSDEQLLETLRRLPQLPTPSSTKSPNYMELWNTLDIECCRRIERWSTSQLLLVCDAWYQLGLARIGEFVWQAMRKLGRKVRKMSPEQLVQSMFLCNVLRRPVFEMFDFEVNLARCVQQMTLQELGVMSMGFFKTQTPIRNPELLAELYTRLEAELPNVENITLVALLKVLRYSSKLPQVASMQRLLEALRPQVERVSLLACLHMALLGSDLQTCDDALIERILERFERELPAARLKDLERICLVVALFNMHSESGLEQRVCERLPELLRERTTEILRHPRCYTNCLQFLTLRCIHDAELLAVALEPRFVRHAYRSALPGREYFHLDAFIQLLGEAYTGPRLTEKQRQNMGKLYTQYIPERNSRYKLNSTDRILVEIRESASTLFREQRFKHVLPHYERCDLVICYDSKQHRAIPLSPDCPADYCGTILTRSHLLGAAEAPHIHTVVIVIAGWNNIIRDKQRHTGQFAMKLQQLRQLGHKPVVIYWHEWRELETTLDRQDFLKRRLSAAAGI
ncbi:FAST kinase domain-containing protein 5, mitochondrial [Scaptodrosophila lebanonensis]|uniref:FAST kinase domain-containing protein 5, mitochondrial n=1 Tax=Drosophila lebanonensis TaxID=7225 RepID=A0A6J2U3Z5_DROLE|nr:FAST kinase domain-containing protein 5, mitochondrial [Scaptodrosophila lebanonensis]